VVILRAFLWVGAGQVQKEVVEGNDPHRGHVLVCERRMVACRGEAWDGRSQTIVYYVAVTLSPTSLMARLFSSQTPSPVIHQHFSKLVHSTHTYLPMKMEQCSETSAYKSQTPGNYPNYKRQPAYEDGTVFRNVGI
jgi:hypothetical protein